ncbi:hypothetical protein BV20DRAFT_572608 [Pilatotrama ljubarskyi]|nr:hypothetical protein BV20DRAFT_572608 [Pilatotrama ljubarskyi]
MTPNSPPRGTTTHPGLYSPVSGSRLEAGARHFTQGLALRWLFSSPLRRLVDGPTGDAGAVQRGIRAPLSRLLSTPSSADDLCVPTSARSLSLTQYTSYPLRAVSLALIRCTSQRASREWAHSRILEQVSPRVATQDPSEATAENLKHSGTEQQRDGMPRHSE